MRTIAAACLAILIAACASGRKVSTLAEGQTGWLSYPSSVEDIRLTGELLFPEGTLGPVPAIVIAHGSGGLDARCERWAQFLRGKGYATFKIDYFGPRGITPRSSTMPVPVHDAYDALNLLASHPGIDGSRIGIIGFSRGAHVAIGAAAPPPLGNAPRRYAAHAGLYPSCGSLGFGHEKGGSPILILVGSEDDLSPVAQCEAMVSQARSGGRELSLKVYAGARHGWDGDFSGIWYNRTIGQSYRMQPDPAVTEISRHDVLDFFDASLQAPRRQRSLMRELR